MKTTTQLYQQWQRIYSVLCERARRRAFRAHPDTEGSPLLTHNWGNAGAREAWAQEAAAVARIRPVYERLSAAAEHRRHGRQYKPTWCEYCA